MGRILIIIGGESYPNFPRTVEQIFFACATERNIYRNNSLGETDNPIPQKMKKLSPLASTMFVSLANGRVNSGYIPNDSAFGAQTFQVHGSRLKPGCAETAVENGLLEMHIQYLK
jgi:hypothetical protein